MAICLKCRQEHLRSHKGGKLKTTCAAHHQQPDGSYTPCLSFAMRGQKVCVKHGGATKAARAAGARRVAEEKLERKLVTLGLMAEDRDPKQILLELIRWSAGHVAWYRMLLQGMGVTDLVEGTRVTRETTKTGFQAGSASEVEYGPGVHPLLTQYDKERALLAKWCSDAVKLGIEERLVRLAERDTEMLVTQLRWMVDESRRRLDLSEAAVDGLIGIVGEMLGRLRELEAAPA